MKKTIAVLLVAMMLILSATSVFAQSYWNSSMKFEAGYGAVIIDGKIEAGEWDNAPAIEMKLNNDAMAAAGHVNYQGAWEGDRVDSDYMSSTRIKWDENYLYILEVRTDDHVNLAGNANEPWTTDGVLVFTQMPDADPALNPTGYTHQIFYTVGKDGAIGGDVMCRVTNIDAASRETVALDGAKISTVKTDTGYIAEIAIPWTMYKKEVPAFTGPKAGDIMGLSFVVHDSDTDEAGFVKQFCYAIDNDMVADVPGGYDFGGWGVVQLNAAPVPAVEETTAPAAAPADAEVTATPAQTPPTGDATIILMGLAVLSAVAIVVTKKVTAR